MKERLYNATALVEGDPMKAMVQIATYRGAIKALERAMDPDKAGDE